MDVDLAPVAALLPWLPLAGAVLGLLMRQLRTTLAVTGFRLLAATTIGAALVVGALGLALGWDRAQWLGAPLGILVLVALSNQADSVISHSIEKVREKRGG